MGQSTSFELACFVVDLFLMSYAVLSHLNLKRDYWFAKIESLTLSGVNNKQTVRKLDLLKKLWNKCERLQQ